MIRGVYRHYKGNIYYVVGFAYHTETNETLVIYTDQKGHTWARPKSLFEGIVEVDGKKVARFTFVDGRDL